MTILAALPLAWILGTVTIERVLARRAPDFVLNMGITSAEASARAAGRLLAGQHLSDQVAEVRALSESALLRDPLSVDASRNLALAYATTGDLVRAERLMNYAERLSRRDVPTLLWLIERDVRRNDIRGALNRYDAVLRVSTSMQSTLLPVLANAAGEPAILAPLAQMLASRPPWWRAFATALLQDERASPLAVRTIMLALHVTPGDEGNELIRGAIGRLIERQDYAGALQLYAQQVRGPAGASLVRGGDFETAGEFPPFDWWLRDEPGLGAVRGPAAGEGAGNALNLVAENGRGGVVARQLLLLGPGNYRLRAQVGNVSGDVAARPSVELGCAGRAQPLAAVPFPADAGSGAWTAEFSVPGGCPAQWLALQARSQLDGRGQPWIDNLSIERR